MERIAVAIFHASTKTVSRSAGRSAIASAAYRAGVELVDERTGLVHDYTRRGGVAATEILIPGGGSAERNALWNAAETAEKRKDARTAREWVIALPAELDAAQRAALAREFAAALVERYGVAVDLAIHRPDQEGDNRNHHAHVLTTTRQVSRDPSGALVLGDKASIELSDTKRRALGLGAAADEIGAVRELWEQLANAALERAGSAERIDSRSLAAQGIDREATQHLGPVATEMERRGAPTDRGDGNRQAAANNARRAELSAEIIDLQAERERRRPAPEAVRQVEDRTPEAAPDPLERWRQRPRRTPEEMAAAIAAAEAAHAARRAEIERELGPAPKPAPAPAAPKPAPDPLERWREAVAQAERGGDAVELVQRRAELAAAAALVAQDKPPTHHLDKIREAGKAAAIAYLRGDSAPAEPRRGPESGDRQAGGATGRATPEPPAVDARAAFRAELEREQQRRDAERQAEREWQAEIERRAKLAAAPEQRERQRLERMSSRELGIEIGRLRPLPARRLAEDDAAVIRADDAASALEDRRRLADAKADQAQDEAGRWRQAHPLRARLHDAGLFRAAYLGERARIEAAARQESRQLGPRIDEANTRRWQARSEAERRITAEQAPMQAKVAELEAMQQEKLRQEMAEKKRLEAERRRGQAAEKVERMAQKRLVGASGYRDSSSDWKATPQPLRDLIDEYNRQPREVQAEILKQLRDDPQACERVSGWLRQRERGLDRGGYSL
jgi:hypothetical protein